MKKFRSANFSAADVDNLVSICLNYWHILENKCTDALNNRAKAKAWEEITQEYCAQYPPRPKTSLREKYDGVKRFIKKRKADEKFARKAAGGGPPPKPEKPLSEALAKLAEVIYLSVEGLPTRPGDEDYEENVGSDVSLSAAKNGMCVGYTTTVPEGNSSNSKEFMLEILNDEVKPEISNAREYGNISLPSISIDVVPATDIDEPLVPTLPVSSTSSVTPMAPESTAKTPAWGNYTPSMLRSKKNSALRPRHASKVLPPASRRNISEKQNELQAKRAEIISRDARMAKEKHDAVMLEMSAAKKRAVAQHTLAIANMRATARQKNKLLALKIKVQLEKKKQQLREHKLRMEILKADLSNKRRRYSSSD